MADLQKHADALLKRGYSPLRAFRVLKVRFPNTERDVIWGALGEGRTGYLPSWAQRIGPDGKIHANGGILHPVTVRRDPRKF